MDLLHIDNSYMIVRLEDGTIATLTDRELILKVKDEENKGKYTIDFDDAILLNKALFKINKPLYDERDRLRRELDKEREGTIY